jgi:hypothetical protein
LGERHAGAAPGHEAVAREGEKALQRPKVPAALALVRQQPRRGGVREDGRRRRVNLKETRVSPEEGA